MWYSRFILIICILFTIRITFKFLKIFKNLSTIVIMLQHVMVDLNIFMTFYIMLMISLSLVLAVLGLGNVRMPGMFQDKFNKNEDQNS